MSINHLSADDLIFDWNGPSPRPAGSVEVCDETLRDGLQATYVRHPDRAEKLELLRRMDALGIEIANVGFPASGPQQLADVVAIGRAGAAGKLRLKLRCVARSLASDVRGALDAAEQSGYAFDVGIFIASSNIRKLVERWDLPEMIGRVRDSVGLAVRNGLTVMFVAEDTTRAHPETIRALYDAAAAEGARRLCISDTVGRATPRGTTALVEFIAREVVRGQGGLSITWHGHRDTGFEIANALAAIEAGASAVEGTALGVGERAGNTPIELLLAQLYLRGLRTTALTELIDYATYASEILGYPIPVNQPVVGVEAFNTGSGTHAAAMRKALELGRPDLARVVYSALDPAVLQRGIRVRVGKMSGRSNVILALRALGIESTERSVQAVLGSAKAAESSLSDEEIRRLVSVQSPLPLEEG